MDGNRKLEARAAWAAASSEHVEFHWRGATAIEEPLTTGVHIDVQNPDLQAYRAYSWQLHDEIFLPPDDQNLWEIEVNDKMKLPASCTRRPDSSTVHTSYCPAPSSGCSTGYHAPARPSCSGWTECSRRNRTQVTCLDVRVIGLTRARLR